MTARLLIVADDYGYSPAYNRGILEAVRAGTIDAAGAMVVRPWCDPAPLLNAGVEVGLHIEAGGSLDLQLERFERLFGAPPRYLDGHHHCHADPGLEDVVVDHALRLGVRVRSIDERQRGRLRETGVATPDRLVGRLDEAQDPLLPEIAAVIGGSAPPEGVTEWMTHPGRRDAELGSRYDEGREADLELLLRLRGDPAIAAWR
ncbi:MAG TPA: ChbG/HpnK family deacetylase [Solirubrobacterales bacterium]|nr:ChbG/HpnK family deacetylase [Solirubrobacterales bacterium]